MCQVLPEIRYNHIVDVHVNVPGAVEITITSSSAVNITADYHLGALGDSLPCVFLHYVLHLPISVPSLHWIVKQM